MRRSSQFAYLVLGVANLNCAGAATSGSELGTGGSSTTGASSSSSTNTSSGNGESGGTLMAGGSGASTDHTSSATFAGATYSATATAEYHVGGAFIGSLGGDGISGSGPLVLGGGPATPGSDAGGSIGGSASAGAANGTASGGFGGAVSASAGASPGCDDSATQTVTLAGSQYQDFAEVATSNSGKSYFIAPLWRNTFDGQSVDVQGLSFTVNDPNGAVSANDFGYPSFVIGPYWGRSSIGSNLPILVSQIVSIPTVMVTNVASDSNYIAASYTLWFRSSATDPNISVPVTSPEDVSIEIWLNKPMLRQPIGQNAHPSRSVSGIDGTWDIWLEPATARYVTYVSTVPRTSISFDLNRFIQDAVLNAYGLRSTKYLATIYGGLEIWADGHGAQMKQ
ncbi:MAG TPA: hypothetical protein VIV60_33730 [Polyangiaceae bacterium]